MTDFVGSVVLPTVLLVEHHIEIPFAKTAPPGIAYDIFLYAGA